MDNSKKKGGRPKIMERFAEEPDSVIVFPFGGKKGAQLTFSVVNLDKAINTLKRNAVFAVPINEVRECIDDLAGISNEIWDVAKKYVPRLYDFNPSRWRMLNDSVAEKRVLIKRWNTWCIYPRCEEIGQIAMAMKVIHKASIEYQQGDFITYEKLINDYLAIHDKIKNLTTKIEQKLKFYTNKKNQTERKVAPSEATAPVEVGTADSSSSFNTDEMVSVEALTATLTASAVTTSEDNKPRPRKNKEVEK